MPNSFRCQTSRCPFCEQHADDNPTPDSCEILWRTSATGDPRHFGRACLPSLLSAANLLPGAIYSGPEMRCVPPRQKSGFYRRANCIATDAGLPLKNCRCSTRCLFYDELDRLAILALFPVTAVHALYSTAAVGRTGESKSTFRLGVQYSFNRNWFQTDTVSRRLRD